MNGDLIEIYCRNIVDTNTEKKIHLLKMMLIIQKIIIVLTASNLRYLGI